MFLLAKSRLDCKTEWIVTQTSISYVRRNVIITDLISNIFIFYTYFTIGNVI